MSSDSYQPHKGKDRRFFVRTAIAVILVLIITVVALYLYIPALGNALHHSSDHTPIGKNGSVTHAVTYLCPMHSFIVADHPGACSICGMTLVAQEHAPATQDVTCSVHTPEVMTFTSRQKVMANVALAKVVVREFSSETMASGKVAWDERRLNRVSARIAGRVERLQVNFTGARVTSGQPLLDIYSPDLVSAQKEYLLALEGARKFAENGQPDSNSMMTGLRDASRSRLVAWGFTQQQIVELEHSRQPKSVVTVSSPATGVITERLVTTGQYVNEGTALYSVGSLSTVWVFAELFENDLGRIESGAPALVTTDAYPGKIFQGRVALVDPALNPETRTLKVRIDLDNNSGLLKPEMFVKVKLTSRKLKALAVPEGAVIFSGERSLVWVENGPGAYAPRNITVGRKGDGFYEVISGLAGGEAVAASGGFLIDGESQLRPAPTGASGEGKRQ